MATKPTIVLVPGAWHRVDIYFDVVDALSEHGYPTITFPLHSCGADPPDKDFSNDVIAIRRCLTKLVDTEEKDVVLVVHSYTGLPGGEAPKGLGKREREKDGLKGGVVRLVFISALVAPEDFQATAGGAQFPDWMRVDAEKGIVTVTPEDAKRIFYNDLPPAKADEWASKLTYQSLGVYSTITTHAAWRHIPSTYVMGEQDQSAITPDLVGMMLDGARKANPDAFDVVEKCKGGHCSMISHPRWLADVLRRAAGEAI